MRKLTFALFFAHLFTSFAAAGELVPVRVVAFPSQLFGGNLTNLQKDVRGFSITAQSTIPTDQLLLSLGQGYDIFESKVLPDAPCIEAVRDDEKFGFDHVGQTNRKEYTNTVSDMASYDSATSSSAGFDFTYKLITIGFETGSHSTTFFNTVDEFARVYSSVITKGVSRIGGKWSSNASSILGDKKKFVTVCGTHYVKAIFWGHKVDQTLRFSLKKEKYTSADENSFSFGVSKLFGFDYSDTSAETQVRDMSSLLAISESRGVLGHAVPDPMKPGGIKELVRFVRLEFLDAILASKPDQSAILYLEVEPYWLLNVDGSAALPRWPNEVKILMENKLSIYQLLLSALSDAYFAVGLDSGSFAQLYDETTATAAGKIAAAEKVQEDFRKAIVFCRSLITLGDGTTAEQQCRDALKPTLTVQAVVAAKLKRK